jgi:hypothetical protein
MPGPNELLNMFRELNSILLGAARAGGRLAAQKPLSN